MKRPLLSTRRAFVVLVHAVLTVAANYLAFWLRFDGAIPSPYWALWLATIPWLVAIRGLLFGPFHLYDGIWQYSGVRDLRAILTSVASSTIVFSLLIRGMGLRAYPRSVFQVAPRGARS